MHLGASSGTAESYRVLDKRAAKAAKRAEKKAKKDGRHPKIKMPKHGCWMSALWSYVRSNGIMHVEIYKNKLKRWNDYDGEGNETGNLLPADKLLPEPVEPEFKRYEMPELGAVELQGQCSSD